MLTRCSPLSPMYARVVRDEMVVSKASRRRSVADLHATLSKGRSVRTVPVSSFVGRGKRRRAISPATPQQRSKVAGSRCMVCHASEVHPAHLIDRSLAPSAGDDPRAVVPLCPVHHREYDDGPLDLSPYLEPRYREQAAWAVEAVGLFSALRRITKARWVAEEA